MSHLEVMLSEDYRLLPDYFAFRYCIAPPSIHRRVSFDVVSLPVIPTHITITSCLITCQPYHGLRLQFAHDFLSRLRTTLLAKTKYWKTHVPYSSILGCIKSRVQAKYTPFDPMVSAWFRTHFRICLLVHNR